MIIASFAVHFRGHRRYRLSFGRERAEVGLMASNNRGGLLVTVHVPPNASEIKGRRGDNGR